MNFRIKEKLMLWISGIKKISFNAGDEKYGIFESKNWWRYIYWLLKSSCFDLFGNGKYGLFLSQKVDGKMIFTDYWKGLVLNFSVMGNTFFFESRIWWKDDIHWLLRSSCFELFGDGKYIFFFSQKIDGKILHGLFELSMIFQNFGNMVFRAVIYATETEKPVGKALCLQMDTPVRG